MGNVQSVRLDTVCIEDIESILEKRGIKFKLIMAPNQFCQWPEFEYTAERSKLIAMIKDFWGDEDLIQYINPV